MSRNTANKELQAKLRGMIDEIGLRKVSMRLNLGREALARYMAEIYLQTSTFRGVEVTIAGAEAFGISRHSREVPTASQVKLRRMIDADGLTKVSKRLAVSRETLARYLADLNLHETSLRGIEACIADTHLDMPRAVSKRGKPRLGTRQPSTARA